MRKSQISFLLIFGLILVAFYSFTVFYFSDRKSDNLNMEIEEETNFIYNDVQKCLEENSKIVTSTLSLFSGYFIQPNLTIRGYIYPIAIYFYETNRYLPTIEEVERQFSNYTNFLVYLCAHNSLEKKEIYNFTLKYPTTKVSILNDSVIVKSKIPLTIYTFDNETNKIFSKKYEDFSYEILNIKYPKLLEVSKEIAKSTEKDPKYLCLSCFLDFEEKYQVDISVGNIDDKTAVIDIVDRESKIDDENIIWSFAMVFRK